MSETPEMVQQEIADLEMKLREKREELLTQKESGEITDVPQEKETLHEVVGEKIAEEQPVAMTETPPPTDAPTPSSITIHTPLSDDMKTQVQELVNVAFSHGPNAAIKKALATGNAALIDAFHDLLVDELYSFLVENGKLKQF